ncbi:TlpA disulfide reductase family protein [Geofilum rubicundum]|uniref:Thiol:disulfide interchange protein n=1 Tax=Geofilum rubicundum JCM 15548 TaxID=1236989 RepID=A0A0E9LTI4_9BACT|nr:TlpA disulfide reductase family protein [Geofilum rubicundum]GAO28569.1 thiol:disulfide interchange protein [Geofilum rubicundum JCM 15548]
MIRFKHFFISAIATSILLGCQGQPDLLVTGKLNSSSAEKVYFQKFDDRLYRVIDSAKVENGSFTFELNVELPEIYGLSVDTTKSPLMVFLEKGAVDIQLNPENYYRESTVTGSALHDEYVAYQKLKDPDISAYIQARPASLVSAYALYRHYAYRLSADQIKENIALLDTTLWTTPYVKTLEKLVETLESVAIGQKAPDFSAPSVNGVEISLSDRLGEGYMLIDFWASWCGPCRRQKPFHKEAFEKYGNKGFHIFSVSLDRTREAWVSTIEMENLNWTHVSDLNHWKSEPAALYGVRAIPTNFLVDKDGIIVAHTLLGEDLLGKLESLYTE